MILELCAFPILCTINGLNRKYGKNYCYPSQKRFLWLMKTFYKVKRSRATLNRWLRVMEDEGYIKRVRRHTKDEIRGYLFKSSLYSITHKGYLKLKAMGIDVFKQLKEIRDKILRSREKSAADSEEQLKIKKDLGKNTMNNINPGPLIRKE